MSKNWANEETFIQENSLKLDKNSKSLWLLSYNPFTPSFLIFPLDLMDAPLQVRVAKKDGLPLFSAPNQQLPYLTWRDKPLEFLIPSNSELKRLNSWRVQSKGIGAPFPHLAPAHRAEALPQGWKSRNTGGPIKFTPVQSWNRGSTLEEASREDKGLLPCSVPQ